MKIAKLFLAFILSLSIFSSTLAAEMVQTREMMNVGQSAKIDDFLAKQEVQEKLAALGVSSSDIKERVAKLTDEEIAQINQKIDELPAGGDVGAVIGVLAFIFIVLLITDILGLTKVFTFTRSVR
jgi:cell division protein FtsB